MAEEKTQLAQEQKFTTSLSAWSNEMTGLLSRDFDACGVAFDEYSKQCAMNAMSNIYQLVVSQNVDISKMNMSNLRDIVGRCASLKLNANALPREVYFQIRNKKIGDSYVKEVEMGVEGDGNDAMLRNFGVGVADVYPVWIVHEGDEFIYPRRKGIEVTPPEWEEKGVSQKVARIVYPIKMVDGSVQYVIIERESVRVNLFAHIRNNLMNETFGLVKGGKKTRYDATEAEKKAIDERKETIYEALRNCETVDEMLACAEARPYISVAWLDSPEAMIVRKMRNNATKKFPKDMNALANKSLVQMDEVYQAAQAEIKEQQNSEELIVADVEMQVADDSY